MENFNSYVIDMIDFTFKKASNNLLESDRKKLYLPITVIKSLQRDQNSKVLGSRLISYRGVDVIVGYENAVVLVHDDYCAYGSDKLISKVMI